MSSIYSTTNVSNINQLDGGDTSSETSCSGNGSDDEFESDEEAYSAPVRAVLVPAPGLPGAPPGLMVDATGRDRAPSCIPLGIVTNSRSLKMKMDSLRTMIRQIGPDFMNICETFEATRFNLENSLKMEHYKVISYRRPPPRVGGGAAIFYTEKNFFVENAEISVVEGVEACWAIFTPKTKEIPSVKRICIGSIYIAPRSKYKQETIDHVIDVMFQMKAKYGNQVNFMISGDFNKFPFEEIMLANGAMKQVISVATRKSAILEVILTDLATFYHPPSSLPTLEVDQGKPGSESDHNIVVFAPRSNVYFHKDREYTTIKHRPLPASKIREFGQKFVAHTWSEVLECQDGNLKASNFHNTITWFRDCFFS